MAYICLIIGMLLVFNSHPFMGIVIGLIGFYIIGDNNSSNKPARTRNNLHCTMPTGFDMNYSQILNHIEQITYSVVKHCSPREVLFMVMVSKQNNTFSNVSYQIQDFNPEMYNITFGEGFNVDSTLVHYSTQTTGFVSVEAVKQELLLQFNWPNISTTITELSVLNQGAMKNTPLIVFRFTAKYI